MTRNASGYRVRCSPSSSSTISPLFRLKLETETAHKPPEGNIMDNRIPSAPGSDPAKAFETEQEMMATYVDTAKTYSQLSLGALVLSVTFIEKFATVKTQESVTWWLAVAWVAWLLSALSGAFYQYLAARFLEARGEHWGVLTRGGHPQWFTWLALHPWPAYAGMLGAFAVGSVSFAVYGLKALRLTH